MHLGIGIRMPVFAQIAGDDNTIGLRIQSEDSPQSPV